MSRSWRSEAAAEIVVPLDDLSVARFTQLRAVVADALRSGEPRVIVDVSELEHLSSAAVTALLWAQRHCAAAGGTVVIRGLPRRGHRLLRHTGLWRVFEVEAVGPAQWIGREAG